MSITHWVAAGLALAVGSAAIGYGGGSCGAPASTAQNNVVPVGQQQARGNIVAVATSPEMRDLSTLVSALQAAGLVEALQGPGPFTVFAPTNAAFANLPAGTLDNLLRPENREQLRGILLYHVHAGAAIRAADVRTTRLSTLNGRELDIRVEGGTVRVNNARVIRTDVLASNGVIHWIDAVVLP